MGSASDTGHFKCTISVNKLGTPTGVRTRQLRSVSKEQSREALLPTAGPTDEGLAVQGFKPCKSSLPGEPSF